MLTVNDVRFRIQDICNEYLAGTPFIHVPSLVAELHSTKEEIIPHLEALHNEGMISFYDREKDTFILAGKSRDES